jgi:hypothetical protein
MKNWKDILAWIPIIGTGAASRTYHRYDNTNGGPSSLMLQLIYWVWLVLYFTSLALPAQSFQQVSDYPYVVTQVKYDAEGNEYVIRQQGSLTKNGDTIRVFPVQFTNECGLVGFDLYEDGFFLHISGQDSVQRVIRYDTTANTLDTIVEVPYKDPFSNRHRGGGVAVQDSILYCSFGYGFNYEDAQDLGDYRGKLLKINLNTMVIDIVAHGLRNPFRFDFNWELNEGFVADVGSNIAEEINYFTGDYSLLNMGWPCREGDSLLIDPDTLCDGYSYSSPEFIYSQNPRRSITGGCFFQGNYYFADYVSGFGGYLDSNWDFHQLPIPPGDTAALKFPKDVTSMAVNPVTNTLRVSTLGGNIYEYLDAPLGIDDDTVPPKGTLMKGIYCYNGGITWEDGLVGTLRVFSLEGRVVYSVNLLQEEGFWFEDLPPGFYILAVYTARGIQYSKAFVKIRT